jgi:hypothetical protein
VKIVVGRFEQARCLAGAALRASRQAAARKQNSTCERPPLPWMLPIQELG